jgi:hypothetical protein
MRSLRRVESHLEFQANTYRRGVLSSSSGLSVSAKVLCLCRSQAVGSIYGSRTQIKVPIIMKNRRDILKVEVMGFSTRHHYFQAEQRAINARNVLVQVPRDEFFAPTSVLTKIELAPRHRPRALRLRGGCLANFQRARDPSALADDEVREVYHEIAREDAPFVQIAFPRNPATQSRLADDRSKIIRSASPKLSSHSHRR